MTLLWFKTFNLIEFLSANIPSRTDTFIFQNKGNVDVMIVQGNGISIIFDQVMLTVNLNGENPFVFDSHGVFIDSNQDIWIGYPI